MIVPLRGGPYDGRRIPTLDLTRHATVLTLRSPAGTRRYLVMPAPWDWPLTLAGAMRVVDSESQHFYEVLSTPEGPVLVHDAARTGYWSAVRRVVREMPSGEDRDGH